MKWDTLCLVPVDNLTSNILGGFKEGSTAHRDCHHCLTFSQYSLNPNLHYVTLMNTKSTVMNWTKQLLIETEIRQAVYGIWDQPEVNFG